MFIRIKETVFNSNSFKAIHATEDTITLYYEAEEPIMLKKGGKEGSQVGPRGGFLSEKDFYKLKNYFLQGLSEISLLE